jgi:N-acetylmuramate 1-kinase
MTADAAPMQPPANIDGFLDSYGWGGARISPVAGDASFRRYFRVDNSDGRNAILMDAPPPHEDPRPFINIALYLSGAGFRAPEIYGQDLERGLVLIEDFGDNRMREFLDDNPAEEHRIYKQAIDTLIGLRDAPAADVPPYDEAAYLREVRLLAEWYMPAMGLPFDAAAYDALWINALTPLTQTDSSKVTVLRDYHAENIMLLKDGEQGIIDFQDALVGHPAYDLVSLLQDARRDVSADLERAMLEYYSTATQADTAFGHHYALLGAQRNTKIIGIFTRLWQRDGKPRYLDFLPRMWGLLERDLQHPELAALKVWFDTNIPADLRLKSPLDFA